ncbi:MAG: hypothetical protein NUW01_20190 [Gemmatimonadaceae bacterium]|nr:hypothetical protein [Gemmatimonadaceae bacterium]
MPTYEVETGFCGNGMDDDCAGWADIPCDTVPSTIVPPTGTIEVIVNDPNRYVAVVPATSCDSGSIVLPTPIMAALSGPAVTPRIWCYETPRNPETSSSPFVAGPPASTVFRQMWDSRYTFALSAPSGDESRTRVVEVRPSGSPASGWAFGVVIALHDSDYTIINASNIYLAAPGGEVGAVGTNTACPGPTELNGRLRTRRLTAVATDPSGATTMSLGLDDPLDSISVAGAFPACQCGASAHIIGTPMPPGWVSCGTLPAW